MNGPRSPEDVLDEEQRVNYVSMFYLRTEQLLVGGSLEVMQLRSYRADKRAIFSHAVCLSRRLRSNPANISN